MKLTPLLARRFLFDPQRTLIHNGGSKFVSFIALISIFGLALGVTALLVVTSVMNGFEKELARTLTAFHGHIILFSRGDTLDKPEMYLNLFKKEFPRIESASPYVFAEVMLSSAKGVAGSVIEGLDPETAFHVTEINQKVVDGSIPMNPLLENPSENQNTEIALGTELARKLKVKKGDTVLLTVPFLEKNDQPVVTKCVVAGLLKYGMFEYDNKYSLLHIKDVQRILGLGNKINAFKIKTKNVNESIQTTTSLNERLSYPMRARDWSSLNRNMFYAIRLEKAVISIILMAIVLVASFNIISTIMMMVHDKKKQISMLKALGWNNRKTLQLFLFIGTSLSVLGSIAGLAFARLLCGLVKWKSIIDIPADIYMFNRLPVEIRGLEWVGICVLAVALALFAAFWPSLGISKQSPVEGLRYE